MWSNRIPCNISCRHSEREQIERGHSERSQFERMAKKNAVKLSPLDYNKYCLQ